MKQNTLTTTPEPQPDGPVECLGQTFPNDDARRAHYLGILREKLKDPEFRAIEGFPIGTDEDILALSDPPYYTACPNPFLADFIAYHGKPYDPDEPYHKEPFAADVSEGKNDPIYNAHSYHTKVPHKAIMRYILHYTKPGDIVLDGFCGTGMTGVAAQMCASPDPEFKQQIEQEWATAEWDNPEWGVRRTILGDLSPIASFIAYNYNTPIDVDDFFRECKRILNEIETEYGWMYETTHDDGKKGRINYTVWSDVFVCPQCTSEIIFSDVAVDKKSGEVRSEFLCPQCKTRLTKRLVERAWESYFDTKLAMTLRLFKQVPVLISYSIGKNKFQKIPDKSDLQIIQTIKNSKISTWFPGNRMPDGDEARRNDDIGVTHIHHFYTHRSLQILSAILDKADQIEAFSIRSFCRFLFQQWAVGFSRLNRYSPTHFSQNNRNLSGTLYVGSQQSEVSPTYAFSSKLSRLVKAFRNHGVRSGAITCQSTNQLLVPDNSIDYIFTDPPFGANFMYSELNFIWEAWLKVFTNNQPEAIENKVQGKGLFEYQNLMEHCFDEYYRVLKPGRWMTVEFSNTKAAVWNAIQTALQQAGFVVANVAALDKQQGSFKAVTTPTAVKQDLVISCYKPHGWLEGRFRESLGSELGVWDFTSNHLMNIPIFMGKDNRILELTERTPRILYDRLVAYFVQHGYPVPVSSQEFQAGLIERFSERDGMYFLPEQVAEYDRKRQTVREVQQLQVFVTDEASAIQWIKQQLFNKPQTTGELTPQFMQELAGWQKHEVQLELADLLEGSFLKYNGEGPIPAQIVAWLKKSADLRERIAEHARDAENGSLATDDSLLLARARDRWYVPDPNRAIDLERLRLKSLLREFAAYDQGRGRLKQFRTEAVRAGFANAWREKDYATIVRVADRLPESVLQEDPDLLMYYDTAALRVS